MGFFDFLSQPVSGEWGAASPAGSTEVIPRAQGLTWGQILGALASTGDGSSRALGALLTDAGKPDFKKSEMSEEQKAKEQRLEADGIAPLKPLVAPVMPMTQPPPLVSSGLTQPMQGPPTQFSPPPADSGNMILGMFGLA